MGACVSVQKCPEPAVELHLSDGSKNDKLSQEVDAVSGDDHAVSHLKSELSTRFRLAVSKDEAFFDSQPWIESDCEDDFMSVNGDFTPSRGSTPVHHKFSSGNPTVNNMEKAVASNMEQKKRLSELFKESLRHEKEEENETNFENVKAVNEFTNGFEDDKSVTQDKLMGADDEPYKAIQCCLPNFGDKKRKTSPILVHGT
ncbi:Unknown protein [Striga hermonthica]|uniref:Uncharacterized protein n=1 Tax=Striga hermonthica TaxID=68872 RepID=A0A9N7N8V1_STRHE|nr:Unknown protein [Striga hermonthica]